MSDKRYPWVAIAAAACPLLAGAPAMAGNGPGPSGQLGVDLAQPGSCQSSSQLTILLNMRDIVGTNVTGFQAFVTYDPTILAFNCGLSSYTNTPFPLHIVPICDADNFETGELWLDGSVNFGGQGTNQNSLLATLVFNVLDQCETTMLGFTHHPPFFSELSFQGEPIPTALRSTSTFTLDNQQPTFNTFPGGCTRQCETSYLPAVCGTPQAKDNCGTPTVGFIDGPFVPNPAPCDYTGTIQRSWTATDSCGNTRTQVQVITIVDTIPPVLGALPPFNPLPNAGSCQSNTNPTAPSATDNCDDEPNVYCERFYGGMPSNCCTDHGGLGCDNAECQSIVCAMDAFCCDIAWDGICQGEAEDFCGTLCLTGEPAGSCDDTYACGQKYVLRWTAVDGCDNESDPVEDTVYFDCVNELDITIELKDVLLEAGESCTRCIQIVTDDCTTTDIELVFDPAAGFYSPGPANIVSSLIGELVNAADDGAGAEVPVGLGTVATYSGKILIPCGEWEALCIKDEQHTLYETTSLSIGSSSNCCVAHGGAGCDDPECQAIVCGIDPFCCDVAWDSICAGEAVEFCGGTCSQFLAEDVLLISGDTDNDSDVDINDVTWFIFQFQGCPGGPVEDPPCPQHQPGGCPWTGVRDADFDCDGVAGGSDYIVLAKQWFEFSACGCKEPANSPPRAWMPLDDLTHVVAEAVNFHRDGVVDYRDVEIFELLHGLPGTLSEKIRRSSGRR